MTRVKLVTFDVTRTLLSFRIPVLKKYLETALRFGIKADSKILENNFREAWKTLHVEHPNFGKESGLNWKRWWEKFCEKTFTGCIKPEDKNKLAEVVEDLITFYATKEAYTKQPGVEDLLYYLNSKSVTVGVISNYDPRLNRILELMELKKYFNFVLVSYDFGCSKPNFEIFKEALRLAGCTSGEEAIHVGDNLKLDYLGAKEAGLRAILISSNEEDLKNFNVKRNEVFEDLIKLKSHFEQRFG